MKEEKLSQILTCALSFILGVVLIIATQNFLETLNYILVCLFALIGLMQCIRFLVNKEYQTKTYTNLFMGVTFIWLALFIYVYYSMIVIILPIIFSLYAFIMFVTHLIKYFEQPKNNRKYPKLVLAIISLILGLILMFRPTLTVYTYFKITGIYVLIISIISTLELINLTKKNNN